MHEERFPKKILYGELEMGKRSHGGQKKRYRDTLKAPLKDFNIPTESWEQISEAEQKRAQRKARAKHHQQSCLALTSVVPSATDSLELELV